MLSSEKPTSAASARTGAIASRAAVTMAVPIVFANLVGMRVILAPMLSALTFASQCKLCQHLKMTKSTYHHGNLAPALVEAALKQVEQDGAAAVSLRDLAQSLGVSRAAPYRHFPDRDALLATVAARGFQDLIVVYETARG